MSFPRVNSSYGTRTGGNGAATAVADTPYARAAAAWDERIGSARAQAYHWRLAAFGCLGLALISTGAAAYLGIKKQVATYVVEVDKAGMPGRITLASEAYRPEPAQVGYFVGQVVRLARERPLDPVVLRRQWTTAYGFLAGPAVTQMNDYAGRDDGGLAAGSHGGVTARTVEVGSILQRSADTYQVRWVETAYAAGVRRRPEQYTGLFRVKLIPPRDEADAFRNPIGVYVTDFTWAREFAGPVGREDAAAVPPTPPRLQVPVPAETTAGGEQP